MRACLTLLVTAVALPLLAGADWPGFRGPERTGISAETGLLKTWPAGGPKLLWQSDKAGLGYAGLAVVGGTVYTMGARGEDEYLLALDDKGQEKWATKIGPLFDFKSNQWSRGPNATPTVDGDLIFALSSKGTLLCAGRDGKEVWKLDLPKDLDGEINNEAPGGVEKFGWGYCWSPLVDGDKLILTPGGSKGLFAALDKKTGKPLWRSAGVAEPATYASPIVATIGGTRQYITQTQKGVVGVSAADGSLLWKHDRPEHYDDVVCPTPIVKGDLVYITVGTASSSGDVVKVTGSGGKFKAEPVWSNKMLNNYHSGVVLVGEHLYGFSDARSGSWVCQELATGTVAWPKGRTRQSVKAGGIAAAEGRLYVLDDTGTVAMLEASPKAFKAISQLKLPALSKARKISGRVWTHPSLSEGKLYLRDQELVFCYQVK
jgi:outer membrane protein assembly factor BamB